MELDAFKTLLRSKLEENSIKRPAAELEQYIRRKSISVMRKIKQSMLFELIFCILCMAAFTWALFHYPMLYVKFFSVLAVVFCVFFTGYLYSLYRKITVFETTSLPVKESLEQIIDILHRFIRLYFQLSLIILPIAFISGIILGYLDILRQGLLTQFYWGKGILFYAGLFVCWATAMYFFTKWYIKRLYGNYLQQLKAQLDELQNG